MAKGLAAMAAAGVLLGVAAHAQPVAADAPAGAPAPPPVAAPCCHVAAGTEVEIELVDSVSAKLNHRGDSFNIRLTKPLVVDGQLVLRQGVLGEGEVVDAAPPRWGGKGAKLILAARYLKQEGVRVPLRSLRLAAAGHDNSTEALVVSYFSPVAVFGVAGGDAGFPAGTRAMAKVAADIDLTPLAPDAAAAFAAPAGEATAAGSNTSAPENAGQSDAGRPPASPQSTAAITSSDDRTKGSTP